MNLLNLGPLTSKATSRKLFAMANGESGSITSLMVKINASNVGQVAEADALNEKREEYLRFKRVRSNSPPSGADGGTDDSCTHSRVNLKDDRSGKKIKLESPRSDAALLLDDHSNVQEGSGPMVTFTTIAWIPNC